MERTASVARKTSETDITLELALASLNEARIETGVGFFDHMMNALSKHGHLGINLKVKGDTEVDDHHSVEDAGICFGKAFKEALGGKEGIMRFGNASVPMDGSLASASVDLSGRAFFCYTGVDLSGYIGTYSEELTCEFFRAFASNAEVNLHIEVRYGDNRHHIHEAIFKAVARALYAAYSFDPQGGGVPSTKGVL